MSPSHRRRAAHKRIRRNGHAGFAAAELSALNAREPLAVLTAARTAAILCPSSPHVNLQFLPHSAYADAPSRAGSDTMSRGLRCELFASATVRYDSDVSMYQSRAL